MRGTRGVARSGGITWLYYTSMRARPMSAADGPPQFDVFRRALFFDAEEKLFSFTGNERDVDYPAMNVTVSPDGRYVVYADEAGMHLYGVDSHDDRLLLVNQPPGEANAGGVQYITPVWAPAGGWVLLRRVGVRYPYDARSALETIRPLEATIEYTLAGSGSPRWSADGSELCADTSATVAAGIGIVTPGTSESRDLTPNLFANAILRPAVDSCAWGDDGRLAVGYDTDNISHFIVAILDLSGTPIERVDAGAVWPEVDYWLPDQSGFVIEALKGRSTFQASAVILDGTFRRFSFDAERVLGVIPQEGPPKDD